MFKSALLVVVAAVVSYVVYIGRNQEFPTNDGDVRRNSAWKNDFSSNADAASESGTALFFRNSRGHQLHARRFLPKTSSTIKGPVVYLFHGWAEHLGRHKLTIKDLTEAGFEVLALDHQGHGLSNGPIAFDMHDVVDDAAELIRTNQQTTRQRPQYIVAHSMGGLVTLSLIIKHTDLRIDGFALSGPLVYVDPAVATPLKKAVGSLLASSLPYLPLVPPVTEKIWHDKKVQLDYDNDPLVYHGSMPALTAISLLKVMEHLNENFAKITKPFLVVHGEKDSLCLIEGSESLLRGVSSTDKKVSRVENAWHEVLWLETSRHQIVSWLSNRAAHVK